MLKLHHFPGTRSSKVLWAALEAGAPVEPSAVMLLKGEHKGPEHMKRHPHGKVPAFEDTEHGVAIIESGAICQYLAEHYDPEGKLSPPSGQGARASWLMWCFYGNATLEVPMISAYLQNFFVAEDKRDKEMIEEKRAWFLKEVADFVAAGLGEGPYLCGEKFSLADVSLGYSLDLAHKLGWLENHASLAKYVERLTVRPAFVQAFSRE